MSDAEERESDVSARARWFTRPYALSFSRTIAERVRALQPSDRSILYGLVVLVLLASAISIYTLEQHLLVKEPAYGGTLTEGEVGNPRFINPLLGISDADRDLSALTYAGLMSISGNGTLIPVLATGYTVSPDGKTYTFTLRSNARFSDGTPVTAADVVFTVQKAQDPNLKSPEYANWSGISVQALNPETVQFTLPEPYAPFPELTTLGILPEHLWQDISDEEFPFSTLETNPVGAGPFKVSGISEDGSGLITSVSLTENGNYVFGRPYLNSIHFNFYASQENLTAALSGGAIQSAYGVSDPGALTAPYARVFAVFWNQSVNQAYTQEAVREALSIAIDRESIVKYVLGGYATPIMGPVPPGGSVTQVPIPELQNPTAAAATILEKAGWVYNGSARAWQDAGAKESLSAITIRTSSDPELKDVATAVQTDWQQLGIPVTIELYEPGDLSQNVIRPRDYEALLYGEVIGRDEDLYAFWDSQERNDPGLNIALYANTAADALLQDARTNTNGETRTADLQSIENLIASQYPAAFIYAPDFTYVVPKNLQGVVLPQITTPSDRFATVATWYVATQSVWPFFTHQ